MAGGVSMPLGTLRSWMYDGLLAGVLLPPSVLTTLVITLATLGGERLPEDLLSGLAISCCIGAALASALTPLAWGAARMAWRTPLASLSLGPGVGAAGTWAAACLFSVLVEGHPLKLGPAGHLALLGFGALTVGMPWMGYLAVRSRGRSGLPAVLGSVVWASGCTVAALLPHLLLRWSQRW